MSHFAPLIFFKIDTCALIQLLSADLFCSLPDLPLRDSRFGFHEEFPNSNKFRIRLPSLPIHSPFIKSTLNLSIFCYFPFRSYLGQSASRTCVERFVTRSGRIPPAFRNTSQTWSLVFFDLVSRVLLLGPWLLLKPYSPSSSTLSPRLLTHALSSTFNADVAIVTPSLRVIFDSSLAQTRVLKPKLARFCLLSSCCLGRHQHSHSFRSRSHACPWPPLLPLSFPLPLVVVSPSAYELTLSIHATHHRLSRL